jgi:hypothetical protein
MKKGCWESTGYFCVFPLLRSTAHPNNIFSAAAVFAGDEGRGRASLVHLSGRRNDESDGCLPSQTHQAKGRRLEYLAWNGTGRWSKPPAGWQVARDTRRQTGRNNSDRTQPCI